jgi:AraC-like DNA-binding protein
MNLRIEQSCAALAAGAPLADAALSSGFYDQSHFVRFFKRYTGMTPSLFQRQCVGLSRE